MNQSLGKVSELAFQRVSSLSLLLIRLLSPHHGLFTPRWSLEFVKLLEPLPEEHVFLTI